MPDADREEPANPPLRPVRRAPNFAQFMITGGLIGLIFGLWLGSQGERGRYSDATAMGFFGLIFCGLGALLAGTIAVLLDRRSLR